MSTDWNKHGNCFRQRPAPTSPQFCAPTLWSHLTDELDISTDGLADQDFADKDFTERHVYRHDNYEQQEQSDHSEIGPQGRIDDQVPHPKRQVRAAAPSREQKGSPSSQRSTSKPGKSEREALRPAGEYAGRRPTVHRQESQHSPDCINKYPRHAKKGTPFCRSIPAQRHTITQHTTLFSSWLLSKTPSDHDTETVPEHNTLPLPSITHTSTEVATSSASCTPGAEPSDLEAVCHENVPLSTGPQRSRNAKTRLSFFRDIFRGGKPKDMYHTTASIARQDCLRFFVEQQFACSLCRNPWFKRDKELPEPRSQCRVCSLQWGPGITRQWIAEFQQ